MQDFTSTETNNKEIHVHVLAKEKNNAQNYSNIKTFLLYQIEKNYWQFHNFKPSKKYYTNESKFFLIFHHYHWHMCNSYLCSQAIRINMGIISKLENVFFLYKRLSRIVYEITYEVHIPKSQVMKNGDPITYINDQFDHIVNIIYLRHLRIHSNDFTI